MKKLKYVLLISIAFILCLFVGCTIPKTLSEIENEHSVLWSDEEAGICLRQAVNIGTGYGTIEIDGKIYPLCFSIDDSRSSVAECCVSFEIQEKLYPELQSENCSFYVDGVFSGDELIALRSVKHCNIFGKQIDEIYLKKSLLSPSNIDAREYVFSTIWRDDSGLIEFYMSGCNAYYSYSTAFEISDESKKTLAVFKWLDNNRFEIALNDDSRILADGSYESDNLKAVLHFETNILFPNVNSITLNGETDF